MIMFTNHPKLASLLSLHSFLCYSHKIRYAQLTLLTIMIFLFNLKNYINNFLIIKCLRSKLSVSEFYTISVKTNEVRGAKRVYLLSYFISSSFDSLELQDGVDDVDSESESESNITFSSINSKL